MGQWHEGAVFYQLSVQSYADSNGDGIGDLPGLIARLDYVRALGVDALWLMPFFASPRRDDGYDVTDFQAVDPVLGTVDDFGRLVEQAHARGLRVVIEMVLNHTSDRHPWFACARRAPAGAVERDFYVWSGRLPTESRAAAGELASGEPRRQWTWDPVAGAYYWHRFFSYEPDLNYDNPAVRSAMAEVVEFWLGAGADGVALSGLHGLFDSGGEQAAGEPQTHAFLRELRRRVDERYPGRVLVALPDVWPEDAAEFFGQDEGGRADEGEGNGTREESPECQVVAHYAVAPRLFMAARMEDRFPLVDILRQTPAPPAGASWALFLRNHDELTLEMVTDEERDYLHRVYANEPQVVVDGGLRRRLAPLLGNNRRLIELLNALLFTLPGLPVLYYGDEIGMGDNIYLPGRQGLRTPMQWTSGRNAGFSTGNPQRLHAPVVIDPGYHYEAVNVETQQANPSSLLWWMRRLISLRRRYPALGSGPLEFLPSDNRKILAYVRRCRGQNADALGKGGGEGEQAGQDAIFPYRDEMCGDSVLVVANLSRFVEHVELDLGDFKGCMPVELLGRRQFPFVGDAPYFLTLGPHSFYFFALQPQGADGIRAAFDVEQALLDVRGEWTAVFEQPARGKLEALLPAYMRPRRWFRSKTREIRSVSLVEQAPLRVEGPDKDFVVTLVWVEYTSGDPETYILPLGYAGPERARALLEATPQAGVAWVRVERGRTRDAEGRRTDDERPTAGGTEDEGRGTDDEAGGGERGLLYDALWDPAFSAGLLEAVRAGRSVPGTDGVFLAGPTSVFERVRGPADEPLAPRVGRVEQSNTSVAFGDRLIMKVFRRIEEGLNPDLEVPRFLTEQAGFAHIAPVAGAIEYRSNSSPQPMSVGIVQGFVRNEGDAWAYTLDVLGGFVERARAYGAGGPADGEGGDRGSANGAGPGAVRVATGSLLRAAGEPAPELARAMIGPYLASAALLGRRTAEMHLGLAAATEDPAFAAEPFTPLYQRSLYQSMRTQVVSSFDLMRRRLGILPESIREQARRLLDLEEALLGRLRRVSRRPIEAQRIRTHGDYHLGQVLYTGDDFVIIDFEGEPSKPLNERRFKRSPLRDVAGMLRSFQYAAYGKVLFDEIDAGPGTALEGWGRFWQFHVCAAFLRDYLQATREAGARFLPPDLDQLEVLLDAYLLEKASYELAYELNNRPDWVAIPVLSMGELVRDEG